MNRNPPPPRHPTHEEAVKAGNAAAAARRKKRTIQDLALSVLKMSITLFDTELVEALKYMKPTTTMDEAIVITQAIKAIKQGDTKAAEFVRDSSGQKPTDKNQIDAHVSYEDALKKYSVPDEN